MSEFEFETQDSEFSFEFPKNTSEPPYIACNPKKLVPFLKWNNKEADKEIKEKIKGGTTFHDIVSDEELLKKFKSISPNCICGMPFKATTSGKENKPILKCDSCKIMIEQAAFNFLFASGILNLKTAITESFIFPYCDGLKHGDKHNVGLYLSDREYNAKTKSMESCPKYLTFLCTCKNRHRFVIDKNKKDDYGTNKFLNSTYRNKKIFNVENIPVIEKNTTKAKTIGYWIPGGINIYTQQNFFH